MYLSSGPPWVSFDPRWPSARDALGVFRPKMAPKRGTSWVSWVPISFLWSAPIPDRRPRADRSRPTLAMESLRMAAGVVYVNYGGTQFLDAKGNVMLKRHMLITSVAVLALALWLDRHPG